MDNCIFCKIREGKIPATFVYQDDDVMVFPDIQPLKEIHLLVVPKKHVKELIELEDPELLVKIGHVVKQVIHEKGLHEKGYRVAVNGGGAQAVDHLHFHVMGPFGKAAKM